MGKVVLTHFVETLNDARKLLDAYTKKKIELEGLKHNRDKKIRELSNLTTRFRSGRFSHFGRDSEQYAQAGGTTSTIESLASGKPANKVQFSCRHP